MRRLLITFGLLITNSAYADTCIPKPDCADMGYTETSCSGAYLKCPFDTSKMICLADKNAGRLCLMGYIYYSDGTCDSVIDSTKTPIGVVVKTNELVMSLGRAIMTWGGDDQDIDTLTNCSLNNAKMDYKGKSNTVAIVNFHRNIGETSSSSAAMFCNEYSTIGTNVGDWFLPSAGEGLFVYNAYSTIKNAYMMLGKASLSSESDNMWTSSEYDYRFAWAISFSSGLIYSQYEYKLDRNTVFCFLDISNL